MEHDITVAGIPFALWTTADGFYVGAGTQNVFLGGSPFKVTFDPPVAGVDGASLGGIITNRFADAIRNGAEVRFD